MGLHEIEKLLHKKEMVSKLKMLPTEWEEIFASSTSNKTLITKICRELKKTKLSKKISEPVMIWANELNKAFSRKKCKWL
jgi:hypothetical protein